MRQFLRGALPRCNRFLPSPKNNFRFLCSYGVLKSRWFGLFSLAFRTLKHKISPRYGPRAYYYDYGGEQDKENTLRNPSGNPPPRDTGAVWGLCSWGPDKVTNLGLFLVFGEEYLNTLNFLGYPGCLYDPTNGTISAGDIVRIGP